MRLPSWEQAWSTWSNLLLKYYLICMCSQTGKEQKNSDKNTHRGRMTSFTAQVAITGQWFDHWKLILGLKPTV